MDILAVLRRAIELDASDIFIVAGLPLTYKVNKKQHREGEPLTPEGTAQLVNQLYTVAGRDLRLFTAAIQDDDFSFARSDYGRFRANVLRQRGSFAAVLRIIRFGLPDPSSIGIPELVMRAADISNGLVLVTGPAGNGKSTTLACLIDRINSTREAHIITLEDPIEYIHRHNRCIVTQREIPGDAPTYISALNSALRESPNVILLGEMRNHTTMEAAITAAETGQLLFSTLHTLGAANTVDRIVDVFPAGQQRQIRIQLAMVLRAVISQQLVPAIDGHLVPVFEVMITNPAIRNLIRESKTHQIDAAIAAGIDAGMLAMDAQLLQLTKNGVITAETALSYSLYPDTLKKRLDAL